MSSTPSTQEEWSLHVLNIHGIFFERRCAIAVSATPGWKVLTTNYPVEYPPPNGPLRGKESSLDIWARRETDSKLVVDALIECKKAIPEFVNWMFFPKSQYLPQSLRFPKIVNKAQAEQTAGWTSQMVLCDGSSEMSIANDAREVRGDYSKHQAGSKTKTSNAAIQEAAYQIALAVRAVVTEECALLDRAGQSSHHPAPPWPSKVYIPLIVTTARLFRVDYNDQNTNLESGEVSWSDAKLVSVDNIVYEYALPKHLQFSPTDPLHLLKSRNSDHFSRMHIFVVHSSSMSAFLNNLST